MTKQEIQDYKDKRNLDKGFNAYWNKGFDEAVALLSNNKEAINYSRCCKSDSEQLFCYSCQAWTSHNHINENNVRCLMCDTNKAK